MGRKGVDSSSKDTKKKAARMPSVSKRMETTHTTPIAAAQKQVSSSDKEKLTKVGTKRVLYSPKSAWSTKNLGYHAGFSLPDIPEAGSADKEGGPMTVRESIYVAIPKNAKYKGFSIISMEEKEIEGRYSILSAPKPVPGGADAVYAPSKDIYGSDDLFPAEVIEYSNTEEVMGADSVLFFMNTVRYRPLSQKVVVVTEVEFEVKYEFSQ